MNMEKDISYKVIPCSSYFSSSKFCVLPYKEQSQELKHRMPNQFVRCLPPLFGIWTATFHLLPPKTLSFTTIFLNVSPTVLSYKSPPPHSQHPSPYPRILHASNSLVVLSHQGPPMASCGYSSQISCQRPVAMALALVSAVVLSPLYVTRNNDTRYDIRRNSGFVLPMVLAGLIIAIKTTSSRAYSSAKSILGSPDPSWVLRIGGSSWGLAGVLAMLMLMLSWQDSVQQFLWKQRQQEMRELHSYFICFYVCQHQHIYSGWSFRFVH